MFFNLGYRIICKRSKVYYGCMVLLLFRLEEWEKRELIEALKKKWQQVNTTYQKTSVTLDTWAKKARKERYN